MTIYTLVRHPVVVLFSLLLCLISIFSLRKTAQRAVTASKTLSYLEENVQQLQLELTQTEKRLWWSQQPLAQEKVIRDELLQQLPGELVIQIPQDELSQTAAATPPTATTPLEEWLAALRN